MEPISFADFYEFLGVELGIPSEGVYALAGARDAEERLAGQARQALGSSGPLMLAEAFGTPGGQQTLLNAGAELKSKLDSVVKRQVKSPETRLGPIVLVASEETVARYRGKILAVLGPLFEKVSPANNPILQRICASLGAKAADEIGGTIRSSLDRAVATSSGLGHLLRATRDPKNGQIWERSIASAFISAALAKSWSGERGAGPRLDRSAPLASAGLFQDLSVLLYPSLYKNDQARHAIRSGQLLREMGFGGTAEQFAEDHHRLLKRKEEGEKAQRDRDSEPDRPISVGAGMLVVANLFVSSVWGGDTGTRDIEGIKALNFLATDGALERDAVSVLTRMYLSKKLALYMEKAGELVTQCAHHGTASPILWNILSERPPQKVICNYADCEQMGSQVTRIAQTIAVRFEGKVLGKVSKGEYVSCRFLTTALEKLYKEISAMGQR